MRLYITRKMPDPRDAGYEAALAEWIEHFIQKTSGSLVRWNLILALVGWIAVLGGTYLTRSGVLQDFSVHSFADSGLNTPLILFLGLTFFAGIGLLIWRWRRIESRPMHWSGVSRESALWLGLVTVLIFAAMVTFGTTAPLLTSLAASAAASTSR